MKTAQKIEPKALLVARVSDVEQRKALPAQKKRLYEYAKRCRWIERQDFRYVEFDETAFKENRKTFNELVIDPLQNTTTSSIVVFDKIDRFSRESTSNERAALTKLFRQGKLEMHFPSDNLFIHKDSPAPDLFRLDIGIALAGYYSSSIRDNVKRRFEQLLADGVWVHRAPVGYKNVLIQTEVLSKPIKDIHEDTERSHFIVKAFELRAQGMSYSVIAKELIKAGFTSRKTGKADITKAGVEKIISNKFYYGTMVHKGKEYKHKYKPLIDRSLFNRCQLVKDERKSMKRKWDSMDFTLKDVVTCGICGRAVSPFRSKQWVYLNCANPTCKNPNTAESLVMGSIEAVIKKITLPDHLLTKVLQELRANHKSQQKHYKATVAETRHEYDEVDKKLNMWWGRLVDDRIAPDKYDEVVKTLTKRQEQLNDKLEILTKGNKDVLLTCSYLLDLANRAEELFKCADNGQRSKLLGFLLSNLQLNDKKLTFTVNFPYKQLIELNEKAPEGAKNKVWCAISYEVKTLLLRDYQKLLEN